MNGLRLVSRLWVCEMVYEMSLRASLLRLLIGIGIEPIALHLAEDDLGDVDDVDSE